MDDADRILTNFGQWCEVEGANVAPLLSLIVFLIDGKERGRFRLTHLEHETQEDVHEATLIISTTAGVLRELAAAEKPAQLAFLAGELKLSGSPEGAASASKVIEALCLANSRANAALN